MSACRALKRMGVEENQLSAFSGRERPNATGHRDWLAGLVIYGHGLRVSEVCDLRWDDIDLPKRTTIVVRRLKASFLARCMSLQPHSIRICSQRLALAAADRARPFRATVPNQR